MEKGKRRFVPAGVVTAIFAVALISSFFSAPFAAAQEEKLKQETAQKEKARGEYELGTMTVTAQKQEENVQEVSSSITVFNELDIEDKKIESVAEVVDFVPNMMTFDSGQVTFNQITTRGISAPSMSGTTSTGMYVDGVPTLSPFGYEEGIIDIERIEVLRGPQGTLYGKNTEAGAINIITRQPNNEFRGKISAEGGSLLSSESGDKLTGGAALSLSGPIQENKLFFDLAGKYKHKDGFIENTTTGDPEYEQDRLFGRAKLRWTPIDDLDISLLVSHLSYDQDGSSNMNLTENGAAMFGLPAPSYRQVSSNLEGLQEMDIDIQSLKILYDINDTITLTSITSRKVAKFDGVMDFDYSPAHLMHCFQDGTTDQKLSQELRLDSTSEKLNWLVGFYYDKDDNDLNLVVTSDIPMMNTTSITNLTGDAYAVFGQVGYSLTQQLRIIGGLRYENQNFELEGNIPANRLDDSWEKISPKIALEYRVTPDIMTYVDISQGYRSGGFNQLATDPQYYSYDEEILWSYEIGMKSLFMDKRIMLNASIFYMDISDMQVEEAIDPYQSWTTNAAEATSKGVELEITARVTDGLSLMGGFGYTDIEFDKFSDARGNYEGNKNPFAPEYTFNLGAQYRHTSGFYARADLIGYGEMFFDAANDYSRDPYEIVNAKIGYEANNFDVYLYAKNLFDEKYDSAGYYGGSYVVYSEPGEVGLQAVYRF
jgi:iron complex outermembrane receptor protein